jgi:hypothetical protein
MDTFNPVIVTAACFAAVLALDVFRHNYIELPVKALFAFFCVLVVSALCNANMYGIAWLVTFAPLFLIAGSMLIRDYWIRLSASKTIQVPPKPKKPTPEPYYL